MRWRFHRRIGGVWMVAVHIGCTTMLVSCRCQRWWYPYADRLLESIGL